MPGRRTAKLAIFILVLIWLSGCVATKTAGGWLAEPMDMRSEVYGGWMIVEHKLYAQKPEILGELIAINEDSMFIAGNQFYAFALKDITP
jgi:hypothetical protein